MESSSRAFSSEAQHAAPAALLDTTTAAISDVTNPDSPGITGYPSNAGTNMGNEKISITGTNFSGTSIPVSFTPTVNSSTVINTTGSLQSDGKTITVSSPITSPFGAVEIYIVNVCVGGTWTTYTSANATESQKFHALATLVLSSGIWGADINVATGGTATILNKDPSQSYTLSFWQGGPSWVASTMIGGSSTAALSTSVARTATNSGTTNVAVAITTNGKAPTTTTLGGVGVGSNGTINVGTSGG
jgi:hypothetical protein